MKPVRSKKIVAGIVHVTTRSNCSRLVGNCPKCNSRLSVEARNDGTFGSLVACMRCKQIYRIEAENRFPHPGQNLCGFGVSYVVVGPWNVSAIMEYLFDNVGAVKPLTGGFVCQPDEYHLDFPFVTVNQGARTIRFGLFGHYQECEAASLINRVVSEFGNKFQLDLYPLVLERWEYQDEAKGFALVEQRQLGALLEQRLKRVAHT
jgi:hypothetical protein